MRIARKKIIKNLAFNVDKNKNLVDNNHDYQKEEKVRFFRGNAN